MPKGNNWMAQQNKRAREMCEKLGHEMAPFKREMRPKTGFYYSECRLCPCKVTVSLHLPDIGKIMAQLTRSGESPTAVFFAQEKNETRVLIAGDALVFNCQDLANSTPKRLKG